MQRKFLKDVSVIEGELQHKLLKVVLAGKWLEMLIVAVLEKKIAQKCGNF